MDNTTEAIAIELASLQSDVKWTAENSTKEDWNKAQIAYVQALAKYGQSETIDANN